MKTAKEQVEELHLLKADKEKAGEILREIRDSETATYTEKLEAIKLLEELTKN